MTTNDSTLYELQKQLFESQDKSVAALAALKESIQSQNATHLVLITKHRGDALLRFANEYEAAARSRASGSTWMAAFARGDRTQTQSGMDFWRRSPTSR